MNRQAQALVLLLLGGSVVRATLTGVYLRYVKEGLGPFLVAAGIALIIAAALTLWYELRRNDHDEEEQDHGGHGGQGSWAGWLLILPALGLLLVPPPPLGAYAVGKSGTVLTGGRTYDLPPLPEGDPVRITLLDYAERAVLNHGDTLAGRRVQVTGFIAPGADGAPILARMVLSCCAADGRPVKVGMSGSIPTGLVPDTWVEVTGRYTPQLGEDSVSGVHIPYLRVESWRRIPAPKRLYQ